MKSPPRARPKRKVAPAPARPEDTRRPAARVRPPLVTARRELPAGPARRSPWRRRGAPPARHTSPTVIFLGAAIVIAALACALGWQLQWPWLATAVLAINAATFLLYAYDKAVAGRNRLRVPERVLHFLALSGGTVAALLAQRLFRHKVSKYAFQRTFWWLTAAQVTALAALWYLL